MQRHVFTDRCARLLLKAMAAQPRVAVAKSQLLVDAKLYTPSPVLHTERDLGPLQEFLACDANPLELSIGWKGDSQNLPRKNARLAAAFARVFAVSATKLWMLLVEPAASMRARITAVHNIRRESRFGDMVRCIQKPLLVLLGAILGLLIAEGALRLAALFVSARPELRAVGQGGRRVVFLGDSNTYGFWLESQQAYPRVFAAMWNDQHPNEPSEVVNLGYPGTNSSQVRNILPKVITTLQPDVVAIMIGANDFWTVPEPVEQSTKRSLSYRLWRLSRLYRLFFILWRNLDDKPVEVTTESRDDFRKGKLIYGKHEISAGYKPAPGGIPYWQEAMRGNLAAVARTAREAGVRLVLITYPGQRDPYPAANEILREVAQREGVPLIDVGRSFEWLCPTGDCPLLFTDQHPTAEGHQKTAALLAQQWASAQRVP